MNLNKVIIAGHVSQAPTLRMTAGGQPVATMGVATNRQWKDKQGTTQESVEFHNVVMWGKTAETSSAFLTKGSLVLVEGRLETRNWQDKDGATRRVTEIIAEHVQFGPRPSAVQAEKPSAQSPDTTSHLDPEDVAAGQYFEPETWEDKEPFFSARF